MVACALNSTRCYHSLLVRLWVHCPFCCSSGLLRVGSLAVNLLVHKREGLFHMSQVRNTNRANSNSSTSCMSGLDATM